MDTVVFIPATGAARWGVVRFGVVFSVFLLVVVGAACSDDAQGQGDPGEAEDVQSAGLDAEVVGGEDAATTADAGPQCPGGAGCPCKASAECDNTACVATPAGRRCSQTCVETCPEGFSCLPLTGGSDQTSHCVPTWGLLCQPCHASDDCDAPGLKQTHCVRYGDNEGAFCGAVCGDDDDCPAGYGCLLVEKIEGGHIKQCVAVAAGKLGKCTCSPAAIEFALGATCWIAKKNNAGDVVKRCKGERLCSDKGLGPCKELSGKAAACVDVQCEDPTTKQAKADGAKCDDGDPCTVGDKCKAGVCAGPTDICQCRDNAGCAKREDGNPCTGTLYCNTNKVPHLCETNPATKLTCAQDADPCTVSKCDAKTGKCASVGAKGKPCDDGDACTPDDLCDAAGKCAPGTDICLCKTAADCADDGDKCNGTPYCAKSSVPWSCKVNPATVVKCATDKDTQCRENACAPKTGLCTLAPLPDKATCTDNDKCTVGDHCDGGVC